MQLKLANIGHDEPHLGTISWSLLMIFFMKLYFTMLPWVCYGWVDFGSGVAERYPPTHAILNLYGGKLWQSTEKEVWRRSNTYRRYKPNHIDQVPV